MATYRRIKFVRRYQGHVKDQVATYLAKVADVFVEAGAAVYDAEPKQAPRKVVERHEPVETAQLWPPTEKRDG